MLYRERYYKRKVIGGNLIGNVYDKAKGVVSTTSKIVTLPIRAVKKILKPVRTIAKQAIPTTKQIITKEVLKRVRDIAASPKIKKVLADKSRAILSNIIAGRGFKDIKHLSFLWKMNMEVLSPYFDLEETNIIDRSATEFEYIEYLPRDSNMNLDGQYILETKDDDVYLLPHKGFVEVREALQNAANTNFGENVVISLVNNYFKV